MAPARGTLGFFVMKLGREVEEKISVKLIL